MPNARLANSLFFLLSVLCSHGGIPMSFGSPPSGPQSAVPSGDLLTEDPLARRSSPGLRDTTHHPGLLQLCDRMALNPSIPFLISRRSSFSWAASTAFLDGEGQAWRRSPACCLPDRPSLAPFMPSDLHELWMQAAEQLRNKIDPQEHRLDVQTGGRHHFDLWACGADKRANLISFHEKRLRLRFHVPSSHSFQTSAFHGIWFGWCEPG